MVAKKKDEGEVVKYKGRKFKVTAKEKMGADGVIETHVDYAPVKKAKPTGKYTSVGFCMTTCQCLRCREKKGKK